MAYRNRVYVCPLSGPEPLEDRDCPSTGYWNPVYQAGGSYTWAAEGAGFVPGLVYTNWTTGAVATANDGNRIVDNAANHTGFPGEYVDKNDIATFTSKNISNCTATTGVVYDLLSLALGNATYGNYTGTLTLTTNLGVSGSVGNLHIQSGTIDVKGNKLIVTDAGGSNDWSGGSVVDSLGGGEFDVTASAINTTLDLDSVPGTLNTKLVVGGTSTKTGEVALAGMTDNLTLGARGTVSVQSGGDLILAQDASGQDNLVGGLVASSPGTSYAVTVGGTGDLERGLPSGQPNAYGSVLVNEPVQMTGGTVYVWAGSTLTIGGANTSGNCYYQTGGTAQILAGTVGTGTGAKAASGELVTNTATGNGNVEIAGGTLAIQTDPQQMDTVMSLSGATATLTVDSGATLSVLGLSVFHATDNRWAKVATAAGGGVTFKAGSTYKIKGWGSTAWGTSRTPAFCGLSGTGIFTMGGTLSLVCQDGHSPMKNVQFDFAENFVSYAGGFTVVDDVNGLDQYQYVPSGRYKRTGP